MFSKRMEGIELSGLRKMFELVNKDSVNLGLGEPDFQPPQEAFTGVKDALDRGMNKYGPTNGIMPLREAIAHRLKRYWKDVKATNVVITSSGSEALFSSYLTFLDPGENVLVPDPGFVLYRPHARLCGAKHKDYGLTIENEFRPDIDEMKKLTDKRTKLIVVNSPSNPTGGMITRQDRDDIIDLARDRDIVIISDEVYDAMVYEGNTHHSFLGAYEKAVVVNSFSKIFAMTGWRMGYVTAEEELVNKISLAHYHMVACPSTPIQYGALAALKGSSKFITSMVSEFQRRRDHITKRLKGIAGFRTLSPPGTFYSFPAYDLRKDQKPISSLDLALELAQNGLICSHGSTFGPRGEYHLRFSFVNTIEQIEKGMDILEDTTRPYS